MYKLRRGSRKEGVCGGWAMIDPTTVSFGQETKGHGSQSIKVEAL